VDAYGWEGRRSQGGTLYHVTYDDDHSSIGYRLDVSLPWLYEKIIPRRKAR
jgi:hypothetical protein